MERGQLRALQHRWGTSAFLGGEDNIVRTSNRKRRQLCNAKPRGCRLMAITVYKYDDLDAPDLAGEPNGQSLQALLEHVLVGQGWTIVHDTTRRGTGTSTDGRIIFERPDADFVFWMDNEGSTDWIVGLADAGFSDGSLTHPQTGERQNGSTTSLMRVDDNSASRWAKWAALYDGASHTLIY